jgi:hypothetical protein
MIEAGLTHRRWPSQVMLSDHDGVVIHADVVDRDAGDDR